VTNPPSDQPRPISIQEENRRPGTQAWKILNGPSQALLGYADKGSLRPGEVLNLFVQTPQGGEFDLEIYRMGWYGGTGGRLLKSVKRVAGRAQPACPIDPETRMVECRWHVSHSLTIPAEWRSGVYLIKLRAGKVENGILFTLLSGAKSRLLYVTPTLTWQAYNSYRGYSLYDYNSIGGKRAYQVSMDRPSNGSTGMFFKNEHPLLKWLEAHGYDVDYVTDVDLHQDPTVAASHEAVLYSGHQEYWSLQMREHTEKALAGGTDLAFFFGDPLFWQVRLDSSSTGAPNRVVVCYREAKRDSLASADPARTTVRWRDLPLNRPENALVGIMFNGGIIPRGDSYPWVVNDASHPFFAGTGLKNGDRIPGIVTEEIDSVFQNGASPPGLTLLAHSPAINSRFSDTTVYTAPSGARVFATGTFGWSPNLDKAPISKFTENVIEAFLSARP
jgi:hypothetical protein